jgi:hypothetical protein
VVPDVGGHDQEGYHGQAQVSGAVDRARRWADACCADVGRVSSSSAGFFLVWRFARRSGFSVFHSATWIVNNSMVLVLLLCNHLNTLHVL